MRRLAMGAIVGVLAFASPVDTSSGEASETARRGERPRREVRTLTTSLSSTRAAASSTAATFTSVVGPQPSAEDDEQAMIEAARHDRLRATQAADRRTTRSRAAAMAAANPDIWRALGECESHNDPRAVSKSGKYRGAFQFSIPTWRSLGYGGDPIDHSYAEQLAAAKKLQARSGWDQWPSCARRLGLI
jgi:hypothetical protein